MLEFNAINILCENYVNLFVDIEGNGIWKSEGVARRFKNAQYIYIYIYIYIYLLTLSMSVPVPLSAITEYVLSL